MAAGRYLRSRELFERALTVIPGGIYGHQNPALLTRGEFPCFFERAEGCRLWDVDGNEFIDFVCAYGPMVVGYGHPEVERAAAEQRARMDTADLPASNVVDLAERLVNLTPGASWAAFAKNGSDVCSWSLAVARQATGRDLVAKVSGTYHGVHGWCNHVKRGFPETDRASVVEFEWNDADGLARLFGAHAGAIAAVIITPFRHEAFGDSVLPADGFLAKVRELCDENGAALVVDDVRAGFRLHLGGSTQRWGMTPDLLLYSKALGNGYALSAMLGTERFREAATQVFVGGTFFTQAVPIAAALATLDVLERSDAIETMDRVGRRFVAGLSAQARAARLGIVQSGPPAIPFMSFTDDDRFRMSRVFAGACARRGVFLHPVHNWFLSAAHTERDIDLALEVTEAAFDEVARSSGKRGT